MNDGEIVIPGVYVSPQHLGALRKVYERLRGTEINWLVCAGMSLALHGMPVVVHDIDLQTDAPGAYAIERLFTEYATKPVAFSSTDRIRSHFGALTIDGIKVEIIGDIEKRAEDGSWEAAPNLGQHKLFVRVGDMQIPVISLEYECEAYRKMGRFEKAALVRGWLDNKLKCGNQASDTGIT